MRKELTHLCMDDGEAIKFLEKTLEAKEIVDKLTGLAQTSEASKLLSDAYDALNKVLSPMCPDCEIRAEKFITSPARLYDPDMANYPGGSTMFWAGEWYCPKCGHFVAHGEKWWASIASDSKRTVEP